MWNLLRCITWISTAQKMHFSIIDFFGKCDQIRSFLRIWSHLLKKSLMENFIFCAVRLSGGSKSLLKPEMQMLHQSWSPWSLCWITITGYHHISFIMVSLWSQLHVNIIFSSEYTSFEHKRLDQKFGKKTSETWSISEV